MTANVLVQNVFNYLCGIGGFAEVSVLLKHPSPLASRKSELEVKNWLKTQVDRRFVVVKDGNDEIAGVRIDLKKKICRQYCDKGSYMCSCRLAQGRCKFWHICKDFIEDNCTGKCSRSHDFFDDENHDKTRESGLDKYSNATVKNIVVWSLPQVCQLYMTGECLSADKCLYLHVCAQAVQGSSCNCSLSHNLLTDSHNKRILNQYDLVPPVHQSTTTEFVLCNIIISSKAQQIFDKRKFSTEIINIASAGALGIISDSEGTSTQPSNRCITQQNCFNNISVFSKPSKCECNSQVDTRNETKTFQPNGSQTKTTKPEPNCKQPDLFNNLANNSISSRSENMLEFMNIQAGEDSDSSSDENKSSNATQESQTESRLTAPNSEGAVTIKANVNEMGKDSKVGHKQTQQQKRLDASCDTVKMPVSSNDSPNDSASKGVMDSDFSNKDSSSCKESHRLPASQGVEVDRQRELSVDSSCSCRSLQEPNKCFPSKKAVFDCIVKEYNGTVPFDVIAKRHDLFPHGCGDIAKWFRAKKDSFLLREKGGKILEVNVFCRKARFCFKQKCSKKDCQYFHVCRDYIAGFCRFGYGCYRNHSFQYDEDRKLISKLNLGGLSEENLRKVLQLSLPQVCLDYNEGCCTRALSCTKIHICKNFIKKKCEDEEDCGLQHESTFAKTQTNAILQNYGMKIRDNNVNHVLRTLLVCDSFSSGLKDNTAAKNVTSKETNHDHHIPSKGAAAVSSREPTEVEVFECLCKDYDCSASFLAISKRTDLFPPELTSVESWFRKKKGSFRITEDDHGMISQVDAYSTKARLCLSYNNAYYGECKRENCSYLHVCKEFITDSCSSGAACPRNHHFQDQRDKALLSNVKLDQLTDEQLRKLVLSSTPQICVEYNNGMCDRGDSCTKIHMCSDHLKKCYSEGYACSLLHEAAMNTEHTQAVLERYELGREKLDVVKRIILVCDKYKESSKGKTTDHILVDKPDAPICSNFLHGKCKNGSKCSGHHCPLPFHWQYTDDGEWKSFTEEDNEKLENLYCDVMLEECSATGFQISFESDGFLLLDERYDVNILLDNKLMIIQEDFEVLAQLRRLSTDSYVTDPGNTMATEWIWYWQDENEVWRKYGQDNLGKDLQSSLEKAYLKNKNDFKFRITDQDYTLSFIPPSDMIQTNMKYGTTKSVRRRPAKLVSKEDICQLKRSHQALPANKQQGENSRAPNVPSHWSPMPSSTQYKRVPLAPHSHEFEKVKKLFRKTIKRRVEIVSIERVQNPFMWEKYQRKKQNMSAAKTGTTRGTFVNERQLFHGTNPEIVEAICKQNFDWRLHGKNATVYGEGSYFALNSSYSDNYAKEDLNGSKFMFMAKVLVGSYTTGHSSYRRPPSKNPSDPASDLYDSCVDDRSFPTIFVVFDTDQSYPEYIIEYSTVSQTVQDGYYSGFRQPAARAPAVKPRHVQAAAAPPRAVLTQSSTSTTRHRTPISLSALGTSAYSSGSSGTDSYLSTSSERYYSVSSANTPYTGTSTAYSSSPVLDTVAIPGVSSRHASSTSSAPTSLPHENTTNTSTASISTVSKVAIAAATAVAAVAAVATVAVAATAAEPPRDSRVHRNNSRKHHKPSRPSRQPTSPPYKDKTPKRSSKDKDKCLVM